MLLNPTEAFEKVGEFVRASASEMDGRILLAALLAQAGAVSRSLVAGKVLTAEQIGRYFDGGREGALETPTYQPKIVFVDGNDSGTKQ